MGSHVTHAQIKYGLGIAHAFAAVIIAYDFVVVAICDGGAWHWHGARNTGHLAASTAFLAALATTAAF
jgi:hypothetical protein